MKHYKHINIPARTEEVVDYTTCDLCGNKIASERCYETHSVTVSSTVGMCYPDNGWEQETSIDLCGDCFKERLLVWFKSQGVEPQVEERDW